MELNKDKESVSESPHLPAWLRLLIAVVLIIVVGIYTIGILNGSIPEGRRIDAVHFAFFILSALAVAVLIRPDIGERLKKIKMTGFELELLEKVEQKQKEQQRQIDDIRIILPLLLPVAEQKHLFNLDEGNTRNYKGSHTLRSELRRLRSMSLLRMKGDKFIGGMKDNELYDLADYITLTSLGKRWVERIREIEQTAPSL